MTAEDKFKCVKPTCDLLQKILADGSCEDCPSHTSPSEDHITCVAEECSERESLND